MTERDRPEIGATVDAGGVKTDYLEAGSGPPVVLQPGFQESYASHCGHWEQIERSADFNRLVGAFLADDDAG